MTATIQILLVLLAVLVAAALIARRLNTAPSIVLVVAGVVLALIPGLPRIELAPELVLLVILPPLIYSAGVSMSWREFRFNLRPISLLAFGCVVFTTCAVAAAAHYVLGLPWAVGFLIGAIVAPPDVVAPLAIARRLGLPHRLLVVLEGEGLANDATALILYRFAVVAISTGTFSFPQAAGTFAAIVVGEIAWGIGIGWLSLHAAAAGARSARRDRALADDALSRLLGARASRRLGRARDRRDRALRELERAAAHLVGHAPAGHVLLGPDHLRDRRLRIPDHRAAGAHACGEGADVLAARACRRRSLVTTAIVIVARFVWVFPATYLPRWLSPSLAQARPVAALDLHIRASPLRAYAAWCRSRPRLRSRSRLRTARRFRTATSSCSSPSG